MNTTKKLWSWGYPAAGGLAVIGVGCILGFFLVLFGGLSQLNSALIRVVVPGRQTLKLKPGHYTIFHEYQSGFGDTVYAVKDLGTLKASVTQESSGKKIALTAVKTSSNYSFNNHAGRAVWNFDVKESGSYTVQAAYIGKEGSKTVLAVGLGFTAQMMKTILGSITLMGVGILLGFGAIALTMTTYLKRRNAAEVAEANAASG